MTITIKPVYLIVATSLACMVASLLCGVALGANLMVNRIDSRASACGTPQ